MSIRAQSPYGGMGCSRSVIMPLSGQTLQSWRPPTDGGLQAGGLLVSRGMSVDSATAALNATPSKTIRSSDSLLDRERPIVTPFGRQILLECGALPPQAPNSARKESPPLPPSNQVSPRMTCRTTLSTSRPLSFLPPGHVEQSIRATSRPPSRGVSSRADSQSPSRAQLYTSVQMPLQSMLPSMSQPQDFIHHNLCFMLQQHRHIAERHAVARRGQGIYIIDGIEVNIEWQSGVLVVVDGPLRQPLLDYLMVSEVNAEYDSNSIAKTSALHHVPKERRMTFDDTHKKYSRLEAMRVAKEQASIREKAADYVRDGKQVPDELVRKYNKALRMRLRPGRISVSEVVSPEASPQKEPVQCPNQPTPSASTIAAAPHSKGSSLTTLAAHPHESMPLMALITHRGISLNGLPSYSGPAITRSWSGTAFAPNGISQVPNHPAATLISTSGSPVVTAMATHAAPAPMAVIAQTSSQAPIYVRPQVVQGTSWVPTVQCSPQAWTLSPSPPARPVAQMRPTLKSL